MMSNDRRTYLCGEIGEYFYMGLYTGLVSPVLVESIDVLPDVVCCCFTQSLVLASEPFFFGFRSILLRHSVRVDRALRLFFFKGLYLRLIVVRVDVVDEEQQLLDILLRCLAESARSGCLQRLPEMRAVLGASIVLAMLYVFI